MKITALTLFKDMFAPMYTSIIGRAISSEIIQLDIIDIRAYSDDKHKKCDDSPYGGGAGMLMTPAPIYNCINSIDPNHAATRIFLTPSGRVFDDKVARYLADSKRDIILLCGHYEGIDNRIVELCIDECISIGDYVLTGGELAAMVVIDAVSRYCSGVLGSSQSAIDDSFGDNGLLEYPQYTRPRVFEGLCVPDVLLSGNHSQIADWRQEQARIVTAKYRPDLLDTTQNKK